MIKIGDRVKVTRGEFRGTTATVFRKEGKMLYLDIDDSPWSLTMWESFCKLIAENNK